MYKYLYKTLCFKREDSRMNLAKLYKQRKTHKKGQTIIHCDAF